MKTLKDPLPALSRRLRDFFLNRRTVASAVAMGLTVLVSYLYVLVGNINNYDNIVTTPDGYGTGLVSGRWMLDVVARIYALFLGNYNLPLFNGLLGLLLLALACQFIFRALRLEKTWHCALLSVITMIWPAAASAMLFSFTVHYYLLSVLLAALSVWLVCKRGWLPFVISAGLLCCSIGLYQAYFPLAAAVLVLRLLRDCLEPESVWKDVALRALRFVGMLAAAMVLYFVALRLCLWITGRELLSYRGINNMGKLPLDRLPEILVRAVRCFYLLPEENYAYLAQTNLGCLAIYGALGLTVLTLALNWRERDWKKIVTVVLLLLALPIAANGIFIMAPDTNSHTLMTFGVVTLFYLPLVAFAGVRWKRESARRWVSLLMSISILSAAVGYAWHENGAYRANYYANEVISNYYVTMVTRAKSLEGYTSGTELVFVGENIADDSLVDIWLATPMVMDGRSTTANQVNEYGRIRQITLYLGVATRYATQEELEHYADALDALPCYPDEGAMLLLDGKVFIKLSQPIPVEE